MSNVIFIFRRDLRTKDNIGFIKAVEYCVEHSCSLIPIYIFNRIQIDKNVNKYHSQHSANFMMDCLGTLESELNGSLQFYETPSGATPPDEANVLLHYTSATTLNQVKAIFYNKDYTPYAIKRDNQLDIFCKKQDIEVFSYEDYTLFNMHAIMTDQGNSYSVYTPFYNKCIDNIDSIPKPQSVSFQKVLVPPKTTETSVSLDAMKTKYYEYDKAKINVPVAGRKAALKRINLLSNFDYAKTRDNPSIDGTTKLSPYMKYGCISVREVLFKAIKKYDMNHQLVKELLWREFYAHLTFHNPHVLLGQISNQHNKAFQNKYFDKVVWLVTSAQNAWLQRWKDGRTGFPFVDAGMRQMKATGWLHNRLRMVVSMFFTKDMMMDWRIGEKYFAQSLVDYDPVSNNGGWQWSASVGADAAPYFRIFNPWIQSKRFDPECAYIRKWIPELETVNDKDIHEWFKHHDDVKYKDIKYEKPMLDHNTSVKKMKEIFAAI
jgi:deoxyribodipyrimidine photo-lyase